MNPIDAREAEIAKIVESEADRASLQQHLDEIIGGTAFKGSYRGQQFLKYVVDRAVLGQFDTLKERSIGVELFGRAPTYDTGEDAIVRVTASDVRRRLLQHYGEYGNNCEFRINLPSGSYIPEITRNSHDRANQLNVSDARREPSSNAISAIAMRSASWEIEDSSVAPSAPGYPGPEPLKSRPRNRWITFAILVSALSLACLGVVWIQAARKKSSPSSILPWSMFFTSAHPTHLITSDPNIAEIQGFTGGQISVSDYANHNYIPQPNSLTPEVLHFCRTILRGDKSAAIDTPIAVNIAELAESYSHRILVQAARNFQLSDLKTDDNFIFLGSPRSDPWSAFFQDELDFQFSFDEHSRKEVILNVNPRPQELRAYVPTARGWSTGQSFGIVAFIPNPDQYGQVLLLAGADAEGTEAAGRLVTDLPRLSNALRSCGIAPSGPLHHFEMLLHLNTMDGSPNNIDVVACHALR